MLILVPHALLIHMHSNTLHLSFPLKPNTKLSISPQTQLAMAERDRQTYGQIQTTYPQHQIYPQQRPEAGGGMKSILGSSSEGPSASQVLAVVTLLPVGGTLLCLAGITLVGSLIGLAVATPVFLLFSPVLVPASLTVGLAVAGFLTSGAFGVTGLSSLSWILNYFRQAGRSVPDYMDAAKRRMQDAAAEVGQKTKDAGQTIQSKAQEGRESTQNKTQEGKERIVDRRPIT